MYILDTNGCIAIMKGDPPEVRARLRDCQNAGKEVGISSVSVFELWYGVFNSSQRELNSQRLEDFLAGQIVLLPFGEEDARAAGRIRAQLKANGKPIGAYDLLIAGQALSSGSTLVTANVSEFSRVEGLSWENWS